MQPVRTVGVLLAAGAGRRFDATQPGRKLDVLIDGFTVAERSFSALAQAVDAVVVAARAEDSAICRLAQTHGAPVVVPIEASLGMGHSLAAGVQLAMRHHASARWFAIALADMPWLRATTIRALVHHAATADRITRPLHAGQSGHPVIFPVRYAQELMQCHGDNGARDVLNGHAGDVVWLDVDDPGVLRDVDTPDDLSSAASLHGNHHLS